jgi:hypothetical protein
VGTVGGRIVTLSGCAVGLRGGSLDDNFLYNFFIIKRILENERYGDEK